MAPEIVSRKEYNHKVDIWAIGVMAYIMLTGTPPFFHENQDKLRQIICKKEPEYPNSISKEAQDFLRRCLVKDFKQRADISELMDHPWIKKVYEKELHNEKKLEIAKSLASF
jgi:serine/threonine protein kinase